MVPPPGEIWPEYNNHADVMDLWWPALMAECPEYQFTLFDEDTQRVVATAHTGPLRWSGDDAALPGGVDDALPAVVRTRRDNGAVDALCAFAAEVPPSTRGRGLSLELLRGMRELGRRHGLHRFIAPVRPIWKERYPITPIDRYAAWRREDGSLFDPWMRTHERLGARVARPAPRSLRISAEVATWERWTSMSLPESGAYVFPNGLAPLTVDRESDLGLYWEPNVWMVHPELPRAA
jgi:hypothetical protein